MTLVADRWPDRREDMAFRAFLAWRGMFGALERQRQIDELPVVEWKGKTLRTLRCQGTSGRGPHDCNVPMALLWSLIDLRAFRCPYHAGD